MHLRFFGHIIRSDSYEDHTRALPSMLASMIRRRRERQPRGRPRQTWLRTVENDLKHQNLGRRSAWRRAYGVKSWNWRRFCRDMLHGDDGGDDDDDDMALIHRSTFLIA